MYQPTTGRFDRLDDFAGDFRNPQSLHKYLYAHGDSITNLDPSGEFILGLTLGFSFGSHLNASRLAQGAVVAGAAIDLGLLANFTFLRNTSRWLYSPGTFIPVVKSRLESHYHSVRIHNSQRTADELFQKMSRFTELNTYPVRAYQNASSVGGVVTWDMLPAFPNEFGQGDFDVKVTKLDQVGRTFVVRTLAGPPLAGWRLWRVNQLPGGDILLETFSVEHAATNWDEAKLYSFGGLDGMYQTWTSMLNDLLRFSGGQLANGPGTVLNGEKRPNKVAEYLQLVGD